MQTLTRTTFQLISVVAVLSLALGINYLYAATWTGPTATAPGNNTPAPLNVSTSPQVKDGNLSVGSGGNSSTTIGLSIYGANVVKGWQRIGDTNTPTQLLDLSGGRSGTDGIKFPDGTVQTTAGGAASTPPSSGVFGANASVVLPGTFKLVELQGMNGAPNGNSTNVLTTIFVTIYNVNGTWNYTALRGGAGTGYISSSGTLTAGVQVCPVPATTTYDMKFCLTRTAGGTLQFNSGAATSQGGAFKYTAQ